MRNLYDFIMENIEKDKEIIASCIDFLSDEQIKDLANIIRSQFTDISLDDIMERIDQELNERLDTRKLNYARKSIINILGTNKDLMNLFKFYNEDKSLDIVDIFNSANILNTIIEKVGISENTIKSIYEISGGKRPSVGQGEILLDLICRDIDKKADGDVVIKGGRSFELKGWGGAILYEQRWKDKDLEELWNTFWSENEKKSKNVDRVQPYEDISKDREDFVKLLERKTGIKNPKNINKLWGAYILYDYAHDKHGFTDLVAGDYLNPNDYVWINDMSSVKNILKQIDPMPITFDWPSKPGASGGSLRCAIKKASK